MKSKCFLLSEKLNKRKATRLCSELAHEAHKRLSLSFKIFNSYVNERYSYQSDSIDCQRDPENEQQLTGENNVNFFPRCSEYLEPAPKDLFLIVCGVTLGWSYPCDGISGLFNVYDHKIVTEGIYCPLLQDD